MKNLMKKIRKSNKGFTLVELIIVVAIIAVLSAVVAPQYIKYVERSRQGVDASTLEEVRHAIEVEVAIQGATAGSATIASDGDITVPTAYAAVTDVTGATVELKSTAAQGNSYGITIGGDGTVTWDATTEPIITALQAGTAEAAGGGGGGGGGGEG